MTTETLATPERGGSEGCTSSSSRFPWRLHSGRTSHYDFSAAQTFLIGPTANRAFRFFRLQFTTPRSERRFSVLSSDRQFAEHRRARSQAGEKDGSRMKTILALAAMLVFALPVAAQNNCNIEPKPLKPLAPLGCADTTPVCLCTGTKCHWTWACVPQGLPSMTAPATAPSWLPSGIDPTIPLQVSPVQMPDLMETYRKALEIRNLQLQQQNQQVPRPAAAPTSTWGPASSDPFPRTEPPSLRTPADRP